MRNSDAEYRAAAGSVSIDHREVRPVEMVRDDRVTPLLQGVPVGFRMRAGLLLRGLQFFRL